MYNKLGWDFVYNIIELYVIDFVYKIFELYMLYRLKELVRDLNMISIIGVLIMMGVGWGWGGGIKMCIDVLIYWLFYDDYLFVLIFKINFFICF